MRAKRHLRKVKARVKVELEAKVVVVERKRRESERILSLMDNSIYLFNRFIVQKRKRDLEDFDYLST